MANKPKLRKDGNPDGRSTRQQKKGPASKTKLDGTPDLRFGNEAYQMRQRHGRKPAYETPEDLEAAALEYFQWAADNPRYNLHTTFSKGKPKQHKVAVPRPLTIERLCTRLGIDKTTWGRYREKEDFRPVIARVENVIRADKIEGAVNGQYQHQIVARIYGLSDKHEVTTPIVFVDENDKRLL